MALNYIVPQVILYQEFQQNPVVLANPLYAFVFGENYFVVRFDEASEKILGLLGEYDYLSDTAYEWPNRPVGSTVDQDWVSVYCEDALLQYFYDPAGNADLINPVSGQVNRIRSDAFVWKSYDVWARSGVFYDRDVAIGDGIKVQGNVSGTIYEVETEVSGFANDIVASSIGTEFADENNPSDQAGVAPTYNQTAGTVNFVDITAADSSAYDGLADGDILETYTIEVVAGSVGEDATTAVLKVTSASGRDDQAAIAPSAFGVATAIGTRGLTVTWDNAVGSISGPGDPDDFIIGQKWVVTCNQDYVEPDAVGMASGTYTGAEDDTYVITVSKGGIWAEGPQITITTTNGNDAGGPYNVTAEDTPVSVGSYGLSVEFSRTPGTLVGLLKGTKYYIPVTAASSGAIKTLILADNLPEDLRDPAVDLSVWLYIKDTVEIPEKRLGATNWETNATQIIMQANIMMFHEEWTNGGVLMSLPLVGGTLYTQYRALLSTYTDNIYTMEDIDDIITTTGPIIEENPLSLGIYYAMLNSNGTPVHYMGIPSDTQAGWNRPLELASNRDDIYGCTPLTFDSDIQILVQGHVNDMSAPEKGRWRMLYACSQVNQVTGILTEVSGGAPLATVSDDPGAVGTQYTLLETTNADFTAAGVRAGDTVRINYAVDALGDMSYDEYLVDTVINDQSIRLFSGPSASIPVASKFEIWRTMSTEDWASAVAAASGVFSDRRVINVWPDSFESGDNEYDGYYLACAVAGLVSGVQPQQGLTRAEIRGVTGITKGSTMFSSSQLDTMAAGGTLIIDQTPGGTVFIRHQLTSFPLTSETNNLLKRELSITKNVDQISYRILSRMDPYIGITNVTPELISQLKAEVHSEVEVLKTSGIDTLPGPQLLDATILYLGPHPTLEDRVLLRLQLQMPKPFNNLEAHLIIL